MTEDEFRRVFHENKDAVYNFALRLTGSGVTAEDVPRIAFWSYCGIRQSTALTADRYVRSCWG